MASLLPHEVRRAIEALSALLEDGPWFDEDLPSMQEECECDCHEKGCQAVLGTLSDAEEDALRVAIEVLTERDTLRP